MEGQIPKSAKAERAKKMIALGNELEGAYLRSILKTTQEVLFEECEKDYAYGHTGTYARVGVRGSEELLGRLCSVNVERLENGCLYGALSTEM